MNDCAFCTQEFETLDHLLVVYVLRHESWFKDFAVLRPVGSDTTCGVALLWRVVRFQEPGSQVAMQGIRLSGSFDNLVIVEGKKSSGL
jgi:hypothetical protein